MAAGYHAAPNSPMGPFPPHPLAGRYLRLPPPGGRKGWCLKSGATRHTILRCWSTGVSPRIRLQMTHNPNVPQVLDFRQGEPSGEPRPPFAKARVETSAGTPAPASQSPFRMGR
jgi:hypothetical protein